MSNIPIFDEKLTGRVAGKSNGNGGDYYPPSTSKNNQQQQQNTVNSTARTPAERDAAVARKLAASREQKAKKSSKQQQQQQNAASSATDSEQETASYVETTVDVPLQWSINSRDQKFHNINPFKDAVRELGIEGDVVVQSAHLTTSDSTIPGSIPVTVTGLAAKGQPLIGGMMGTVPRSFAVPHGQHHYYNTPHGKEVYTRKAQTDAADFAEHVGIDVARLKTDVQPYYGKGGELAETHVEVLKNRNSQLYDIVGDSSGVDSRFAGDSTSNPSWVLSKSDHDAIVNTYQAEGGYKRVSRISPEDVSFQLHHYGTKPNDAVNQSLAFDHIAEIPGQTAAERSERVHAKTDHRIFADMRFVIAHKPVKPASAASST